MVNPKAISTLLTTMQKKLGPHVWHQGEKLVTAFLVEGIRAEDDEIELRVHAPGTQLSPVVLLYPEDDDWECSCRLPTDNCAHAAAAIIAVSQAMRSGKPLPCVPDGHLHMAYHFQRRTGGLGLVRWIVGPGAQKETLRQPLLRMTANRSLPRGLHPEQRDLTADRIIGSHLRSAVLPSPILLKLTGELEGASVFLENTPIQTSSEPLLPRIRVAGDGSDGAILILEQNPDVDEIPAPETGLSGNTLQPLGQVDLCGVSWEKLPVQLSFAKADLAYLVAEVLPRLEKDNFVQIRTLLPATSRFLKPYLHFEVSRKPDGIGVTPFIVYGTPPHVRIQRNRMVYLEGTIPVRDGVLEKTLESRLRDEFHMVTDRTVTYRGKDATHIMDRIHRWETEEELPGQRPKLLAELIPEVRIRDDQLTLIFAASDPQTGIRQTASEDSVLSAFMEGMGVAPLTGGGFAKIPQEWLQTHGNIILDILNARDADRRIATAALPRLAAFCDALGMDPQPFRKRILPLLSDYSTLPVAPLPPSCTAILRDYQQIGLNWLCFLRSLSLGALLADDMGLGKTVQALCAIDGRTLVVCPTSVIHNWKEESLRFRPDLRVCVFHGTDRQLDPEADLVVTNYALLRLDRTRLSAMDWRCIILDEAQNIKNPSSQSARAACALKADFRVALSGTPVENRLEELWSIFRFVNPGHLGSYTDFQRRFVLPITSGDPQTTGLLRRSISPYLLRRTKQEVEPELPPRTDIRLECELSVTERDVYEAIQNASREAVLTTLRTGGGVLNALELLLRLRQASCHPSLIPGRTAENSAKLNVLLETLSSTIANGHKAVVFSQWTSLLDLLEPHLRSADLSFLRLDGSTRNRSAVIHAFQETADIRILIASLKAGGTGLNLTAADHVFLLDPWWNPAVEDQAADRAHRIGQDKPVVVYRLVSIDTVEEKILALQVRKRLLAKSLLEDGTGALSLTREDLIELLT